MSRLVVLKSDSPAEVQRTNISSILKLTSILKSCLGPKSYQKFVLSRNGAVEITSDGNAILRELDTSHCASRCLLDLCRSQDLVGDGTTSCAILSGDLLRNIQPLLYQHHPSDISLCLRESLNFLLSLLDKNSFYVDKKDFVSVVRMSLKTKLVEIFGVDLGSVACDALEILYGADTSSKWTLKGVFSDSKNTQMHRKTNPAVLKIKNNPDIENSKSDNYLATQTSEEAKTRDRKQQKSLLNSDLRSLDDRSMIESKAVKESSLLQEETNLHRSGSLDIELHDKKPQDSSKRETKTYFDKTLLRVLKIPGDSLSVSVFSGAVVNKTIFFPGMRTRISNPRVVLIESGLDYSRNASQTHFNFNKQEQFSEALLAEENAIRNGVSKILAHKPDVLCVTKGVCDLALGLLHQNNCTVLRRFKQSEIARIAKSSNARVASDPEALTDDLVGTSCSNFDVLRISGESFCFFEGKNVATVIINAQKEYARELERNFEDALGVAKCLYTNPRVVTGGGSIEFFLGQSISLNNNKNHLDTEITLTKESPQPLNQTNSINKLDSINTIESITSTNPDDNLVTSEIVHSSSSLNHNSNNNPQTKLIQQSPISSKNFTRKRKEDFKKVKTTKNLRMSVDQALSDTLSIIPTLLANNAGENHLKALHDLETQFKTWDHKRLGKFTMGIDGNTGHIRNMKNIVLEPIEVKAQALKSIIDTVSQLIRVDGVLHGSKDK